MPNRRPEKLKNLLQIIRDCLNKGKYRDTSHAVEQKNERHISLPEIIYVLKNGWHEKAKDKFEEAFNSWNYSIRGKTIDNDDLRIIVSFDNERDLLIITAFYLD